MNGPALPSLGSVVGPGVLTGDGRACPVPRAKGGHLYLRPRGSPVGSVWTLDEQYVQCLILSEYVPTQATLQRPVHCRTIYIALGHKVTSLSRRSALRILLSAPIRISPSFSLRHFLPSLCTLSSCFPPSAPSIVKAEVAKRPVAANCRRRRPLVPSRPG